MSLQPGAVFAGFTIERELGAGGMGVVYLARHPRLPRHVALKLLRTDLGADPSFVGRFEREADTVAQLDHPNIVPIDDCGAENGQLWLSMRFINGTTADKALSEYPHGMPPERAVHIVEKVAAALDFAHRRQLIHRDVKPANILLTEGGDEEQERVFLSDFGVAKAMGEMEAQATALTAAGGVVATIDYAAPEQIEGRALDGRCDIYALGCVLYKLLVGTVPYPGDTLAAKVYARLHNPPPTPSRSNPGVPPAFDAVVAKALAREPEARYQTCRALATAARQALAGTVDESVTRRVDTSDLEPTRFVPPGGVTRPGPIAATPFVPDRSSGPGGASGAHFPPELAGLMAPPPGAIPPVTTTRSATRRRSLLAVGAVLIVAAIVVALAFVKKGSIPGQAALSSQISSVSNTQVGATAPTTPSSSSSTVGSTSPSSSISQSSSTTPSANVLASLPRSAPIDTKTMLVGRSAVGGSYGIYTYDTGTKSGKALLTSNVGGMGPVLSADRQTIMFNQSDKSTNVVVEVDVAAADGNDRRKLFSLPTQCVGIGRIAWNPKDQNLVALSCTTAAKTTSALIVDLTGAVKVTLPSPAAKVDQLAFSPDGTQLTFWGSDDVTKSTGALYVQSADGQSPAIKIVDDGASYPAWSPNGQSIAYRSAYSGGGQIAVVAPTAGATPKLITAKGTNDIGPAWSPGGSQIAFKRNSNPASGQERNLLWVMDADGQHPEQLDTDDANVVYGAPTWTCG